MYNNEKSPIIQNTQNIINQNIQNTRIEFLKILTGIKDLEEAFYNEQDEFDEIEIIYNFLKQKPIPYEDIDAVDFLITYIGFSYKQLKIYDLIDEVIYYNCSYHEIIYIALFKILTYPGNSNLSYECDSFGFPKSNNFNPENTNKIINVNGIKMINLILSLSFNILSLENSLKNLSGNDNILLYHGTSWSSARSIRRKINPTIREKGTDFGLSNFYIGSNLNLAIKWAKRNNYPAIVVFQLNSIPFLRNLDFNDSSYINYQKWKEFVYNNRTRIDFAEEIDDNYDIITGPILKTKNPQNVDDCKKIIIDNTAPYQFSFKTDEAVREIQNNILLTIYLPRG